MKTATRRDWTRTEKLQFEDIALEYIRWVPKRYQNRRHFEGWLLKVHPEITYPADMIWSYVLAN